MSKNLDELCCCFVEDFFGNFHAQIYSQLAYHGRLSAMQVAQKTRLPLRHVKIGLAALIQSRILYHHTSSDGQSTYQANTQSTYNLIRIGRLVDLVKAELGETAAEVLTEAFISGFATIAEIEQKVSASSLGKKSNLINGDDEDEHLRIGHQKQVKAAIKALLDHGYLIHVRAAHLQSRADVRRDAELHVKNSGFISAQKGKRAAEEQESHIMDRITRQTTSRTSEHGYVPTTISGKKRSLDEEDGLPTSKKRKVNGDITTKVNGYSSSGSRLEETDIAVLVTVNFNKLVSNIRDDYITRRSKKVMNERGNLKVLRTALSKIPAKMEWQNGKESQLLDLGLLRDEINNQDHQIHLSNGHAQNGSPYVNGTHEHNKDGTERITYNEVDRALALLAGSDFDFLPGSYGDWTISKSRLDRYVQRHEILRLMNDRLRPPALRIVRMLQDKGKLDEKALQEIGLLPAKDLRQTLAELKQMGYIDLQEVPRESQRQPNRTIFLWFYDLERVQKVLLDSLYKAMARLMQRLNIERRKVSSTLEKAERSDVQGNEEEMMQPAEARVWKRWRRTEQWLYGELARLDDSVILLRDL